MKCPLCDGTVVNGRCKECGMPYRNDEILYHLNESRSDHYRHASDKARKIMQTQSAGVGSPGKEVPERLLAIGIHLLAEKKSGLQKLRSIQNLGYFG